MNVVRILLAVALVNLAATTHAVIINLNSTINNSDMPVVLTGLDANLTYSITQLGVAGGGTYSAWNAWNGSVSGCDGDGANCSTGWVSRFFYRTNLDSAFQESAEFNVFASPSLALDAATAPIIRSGISSVAFFISDNVLWDNIGGISLDVVAVDSQVPEPPALVLFGIGLLVLGVARKKLR